MGYCVHCGKENDDKAKYCVHCGEKAGISERMGDIGLISKIVSYMNTTVMNATIMALLVIAFISWVVLLAK